MQEKCQPAPLRYGQPKGVNIMSTNVKPGPVAPKNTLAMGDRFPAIDAPVTEPVVTADPILVLLTEQANEAIAYAQSFGPLVQKSADFVKVLAHLDGMGHAGNDDEGESDLANALRSIVQTFDTATATVALTVARAKYATVVQYCKGNGIDLPANLLSLTAAGNNEGGQKRLKGYTYSISANGQSVSYANVADLATALKGKAADFREAAHATVGDERPDSFSFEIDGITVTATKGNE